MAENIGKIIVSIEAEVAELRKGLAQAEAEFKKSAKKMEESQASMASNFKRSWVELASKISVVTTALNIAEKTLNGLSDAMKVWGEEGTSAAEKVGGSILAFGDAGIPVISDVINAAEALASLFIDVAGAIEEAKEAAAKAAASTAEWNKALASKAVIANMQARLEIQKKLTRIAMLETTGGSAEKQEIAQTKRAMQRLALETRLEKEISQMRGGAQKESAEAAAQETLRWFDYETNQKMTGLALRLEKQESLERDARERKLKAEKELADRIAQQEIEEAKRVADKTMDLQTKLNIMIAKQAGNEEEARTLAIEARYDKMLEGASSVNREIILQMKAIEMAGVGGDAGATSTTAGGGGGTATISTAMGGFTVASGGVELKKQTSLLKRIAKATEKLGDKGAGEVVVLAA